MGEVPATPPNLSEEGQEFLSRLLQHDPKLRDSASSLLEHNFLKVISIFIFIATIERNRLILITFHLHSGLSTR
jgi:serine/threonine protein kinase